MSTDYTTRYAVHEDHYRGMDTAQLRQHFLVDNLFADDQVNLTYTHYERFVVGGARPVSGPLQLDTIDAVKADYFLARRELGVINVGGAGTVSVDGEVFELACKEALYVGAGAREVIFHSADSTQPAQYYLNSAPAHKSFPHKKIGQADADVVELGSTETSNKRVIRKLMVNSVVETCQLQMGMTELLEGSVWNTMPAHVHDRRMEAYFYFNLPQDQAVCHFMGPQQETRHIWVKNEQAVVSPPWSMHCGAGTASYIFIWGMAGENLDYDDMDKFQASELK
ncbi:MAG: 5-dehydro-4-deoxy-D-glucuronate isomerase [Gammaproteobacteria bacterium]|nr:5-dehydro-4-deoxy-D-glucuronate isomerase [Gammaproteobacteria bacterium]